MTKLYRVFFYCFVIMVIVPAATYLLEQSQTKTITKVPTTQKVIALTVDDGPHYKTTPELLRVLKEKQVHVTLFVLGANAAQRPDIVAQAVADGQEIGTHAYTHESLKKLSEADIKTELDRTEKAILSAGAPKPSLFRPPGGAYDARVLSIAQEYGYKTILWSVDPHDWERPSVNSVVKSVLNNAEPGKIVLLHDGQYPLPTPEAIGIIIDRLREQGYEIVTISELLQDQNRKSVPFSGAIPSKLSRYLARLWGAEAN